MTLKENKIKGSVYKVKKLYELYQSMNLINFYICPLKK